MKKQNKQKQKHNKKQNKTKQKNKTKQNKTKKQLSHHITWPRRVMYPCKNVTVLSDLPCA